MLRIATVDGSFQEVPELTEDSEYSKDLKQSSKDSVSIPNATTTQTRSMLITEEHLKPDSPTGNAKLGLSTG